jgi:RIO kinase 1
MLSRKENRDTMLDPEFIDDALKPFFKEHLIQDVHYAVKSGKEATVFLCEADPSVGVEYLIAKIYRPRESRSFKNDAVYHAGVFVGDRRMRKAIEQKSRHGRAFQFVNWIDREYEALRHLHAFGADVPKTYARSEHAILMQFIGEGDEPALPLNRVSLNREDAEAVFDRVLRNVELWLSLDYIHADLSAFNILYHGGSATVIDFPQTVNARTNPHAYDLLQRDIDNVCRYFARYGIRADASRIAGELWTRFALDDL